MKPSLKKKIALGFLVGVIILLTIGILSYQSILNYEEHNSAVKYTQNVVDKIESLNALIFRVVAVQRGYVITGDTVFSNAYITRKAEIPVKINELRPMVSGSRQDENLKKLESVLNINLARTDSIIHLRNHQGFEAARELQQKTADQRILAEVTALTDLMKKEELAHLNHTLIEEEKSFFNTKTAIIAGSIFAVIFAVVCFLIILRDIDEKRRIEIKLEESDALYKTLVKNLPDETITIYNREMRYLLVDGGGFEKLKYDPKKLEGKLIKEAIPPENYSSFEPFYRGVFEGKTSTLEYNFQDRIIEITFLPLPEKNGKEISHGMVITHDITERKKAEEDVRKSEALYKTIMSSYPRGSITLYDKELRILLADGSEITSQGFSKDSLLNKRLDEIFPPEILEPHRENLLSVFDGKSNSYESSFNGEDYIVTNIPIKNGNGKVTSGLSISNNITRLKETEKALRRSEALYRSIMSAFPQGTISLYNKDTAIVMLDGEDISTLGFRREDLIGKKIKDLIPALAPDAPADTLEKYTMVFEGKTATYESNFKGNYYLVTNTPIRQQNGDIMFGMSISRNITPIKRAEEEAKRSQLLYKTMMENFPNGTISLFNKDLIRTIIGGQELTRQNISLGDVINKPIEMLLPETDYEQYLDYYRDVFKGNSATFEVPFEERTYLISVLPIKNENGEIISGMSISQNISHLKNYEKKITESRDFYLTLFEEFPSLIWRAGTDGAYNYFNRRWLKFTGKPMEQEIGEGWRKGIHEDDLFKYTGHYNESFSKRAPFEVEYRLKRHDGEYRWMLDYGTPYYDPDNNFAGYIGTSYDITERKTADDRLKRSEALLSQAQEIAHTGSWEWNTEANVLTWSDELYRIFGLDPQKEPITYEQYVSMLHPDTRDMVLNTIQEAYKSGGSYDFEHKIIRPTGEVRILHGQGRVVTNEAGIVTRLFGVAHDITERKMAEEQLKEANRKLLHSEKLAALGRFSSNISHEIRNPLANISASAQLIMSKFKPEAPLATYLDIIMRNSTTASRIIKELLDFASPRELLLEMNDIFEVINEACELVSPRCQQSRVSLNFINEAGNIPPILMNQEKLQEALLNFLSNAIDAMPLGGKLDLVLRRADNLVELDITDTGYGIPPENIEKIFEPFFTTKENGTGLGVSLAHQIIQNHNGRLDIESKVGEGTTIKIKLPLQGQ
jgi:PAS domain S-box-containing protein